MNRLIKGNIPSFYANGEKEDRYGHFFSSFFNQVLICIVLI
jgi:hypothetical protein